MARQMFILNQECVRDPPRELPTLRALDPALEGGVERTMPYPEPVQRIWVGPSRKTQHCIQDESE